MPTTRLRFVAFMTRMRHSDVRYCAVQVDGACCVLWLSLTAAYTRSRPELLVGSSDLS
jgi:hypothetical protein